MKRALMLLFLSCSLASAISAQTPNTPLRTYPAPVEGDYIIPNFHFRGGETLPELKIHYRTIGTLKSDSSGVTRNAVLIGHGTGGSGTQFLSPQFAGVLFGPGQLLDATRYFIILTDGIGHGNSSNPSDGLHARFPHYTYDDMVVAQYELLTKKLGVNRLRLVMGTSMGGMHTWVWGETYPDFMDALMPLASLPIEIAGRNRIWRRMAMDAIRNDPEWQGGEYKTQPTRGLISAEISYCWPVARRCNGKSKRPRAMRPTSFIQIVLLEPLPDSMPTICYINSMLRANTTLRRSWKQSSAPDCNRSADD